METDLDPEQKKVYDLVVNERKSVYLTGMAGSGKSHLVKVIVERLRETSAGKKGLFVTATTGMASSQIGGCTFHSFMGFKPCDIVHGDDAPTVTELSTKLKTQFKNRHTLKQRWKQAKWLVVDEISMLDDKTMDVAHNLLCIARNCSTALFGGISVLLVGDFLQLPPVKGSFAFRAACWKLVEHNFQLKKIYRQDEERLQSFLNSLRLGAVQQNHRELIQDLVVPLDCRGETLEMIQGGHKPARLFSTNEAAGRINEQEFNALSTKIYEYRSTDSKNFSRLNNVELSSLLDSFAEAVLCLRVGCQVMLTTNIKSLGLVNGNQGVITDFHDCGNSNILPVVKFPEISDDVVVCPQRFDAYDANGLAIASRYQIPLKHCWALTIHKAQGKTLSLVEIDLDRSFAAGMAYVGLSRAKKSSQMFVKNFSAADILVSSEVLQFYRDNNLL